MSVESITAVVDHLCSTIGVKPAPTWAPLAKLRRERKYDELCRAIGTHMGVPNEVKTRFVSKEHRFSSTGLSRTDALGHGTDGIVAQVTIPGNLPPYGTVAFRSHTIEVSLGAEFVAASAETAVTLLAHELAHVLLYALRHPERSSEQATDSVPLVLGFGAIVARGRQAVTRIEHRSATATRTTTFGYLSDEEFAAATRLVAVRLAERVDRENVVHASSVALRRRLAVLESRIRRLRQVTQVSDHRGTKVRNVDAQRLVAMHASDYFDDLERRTIATVKAMAQAERLRTKLALPTERAIERLDRLRDFLTSESDRLATLEETVRADFRAAVRSQPAFARTLFTMGDALESLRTHITPPPHNER